MTEDKECWCSKGQNGLTIALTTSPVTVKRIIAVSGNHLTARENHMPYGITQCYLSSGSGDFPALPQPKLVLDLATPEGCKAELM